MKFPLADWIDEHPDCRHHLAHSGMQGTIPPPRPTASDLRSADEAALRRSLSARLDTDARSVFLIHGATEANAAVLQFLAHRTEGTLRARVQRPEYPPLLDAARWFGYDLTERAGPVTVATSSQPRNPEGDLWGRERLLEWSRDSAAVVLDETFREFAGTASLGDLDDREVWRTGSFTKFYAADALRVGFVVAPAEALPEFARFHGLLYNEVPTYSIATAQRALREHDRIRRAVAAVLETNRAAWRRRLPGVPVPAGPVAFDREIPDAADAFVDRLLRASVLVCPGRLFEDPHGVRIGLTRRSFPTDLDAYLSVRAGSGPVTPKSSRSSRRSRPARSRPGSRGPARAARP